MKTSRRSLFLPLSLLVASARAHDLAGGPSHAHDPGAAFLAPGPAPAQAAHFGAFAPRVTVRWDETHLIVENDGMPEHGMMTGITAWQQQVPRPQAYTGANAWRFPLRPVPAEKPVPLRDRFLRGAVALAVNGIPIFNPQNNRGEISADIGELDQWGGHCGRADDYHYHVAPLHLQDKVGRGAPIAYALDGYPILGPAEPDGSAPAGLDACHGHETRGLGYHYHATTRYPFIQGAFHGEVTEREGQVDPQPRATPVRPALTALRGARITGFARLPDRQYRLDYAVDGKPASVRYGADAGGAWTFQFTGADGIARTETYREGDRPAPGGGERARTPREGRPPRDGNERGRSGRPTETLDEPSPARGVQAPSPAAGHTGTLVLTSSAVGADGALAVEHTGDGAGVSPPLAWRGSPAGTRSFALVMDHVDPQGAVKWYWTLHHIPATVSALPAGADGIGVAGTSFKGAVGYEPPHSRGPGRKEYSLTLYALSADPALPADPARVDRDTLLAAIRGLVLDRAELRVSHTREGEPATPREPAPAREPSPAAAMPPARRPADAPGLVKPALSDTVRLSVYADNWFMLYINGRLAAVDSIDFLPHNVVSVDVLPEYPMTIAVLAKDNADPRTGMEYGNRVGDGGFILKFSDGTVTSAAWKARSFFRGPLGRDTANPRVETTPLPDRWYAVDFDDRDWSTATAYSEERVNPKESFRSADFSGASFIWTPDLDLDNTVILRTRVDKPGWSKRWTTTPDLDVSGAPGR